MATLTNALCTTNKTIVISSGTGAINIGTDAVAKVITLGNATGATGIVVTSGSAGVTFSAFTNYGAVVSNTAGLLTDAASTAGYVLTGNSGSAPSFQAVSASGAITTIDGNSGSITPTAGIVTISGDGTILTSSGSGSTLSLTTQAVYTLVSSSGTATASSNAISVVGAGTISTSASGSTITITGTGGAALTWNNTTGSTQSMAVQNGYVSNDTTTLVTFTLPSTASIGQMVAVQGSGSGLWTIAQNASQTIHLNGVSSTTGTGGTLSSTGQYDTIYLMCITANTDWAYNSGFGNYSIV